MIAPQHPVLKANWFSWRLGVNIKTVSRKDAKPQRTEKDVQRFEYLRGDVKDVIAPQQPVLKANWFSWRLGVVV